MGRGEGVYGLPEGLEVHSEVRRPSLPGIFWDFHGTREAILKRLSKIMYLFSSNSFFRVLWGGMGSMVYQYQRDLRFSRRSGAFHGYILGLSWDAGSHFKATL